MRWRQAAFGGSAAIGAAAAYNALATRGVAPLPNVLGGTDGWFHWRGHRVAYSCRGEGPPLILLHSIHPAGWSLEWQSVVDSLSARYTVYAPDLLGFGRSDRPAMRYTASLYTSLIADFAAQVVHQPCVLVASSLAGAYAIALGARDPGRFPALVLIEPTGLIRMHRRPRPIDDARRLLIESPVVGTAVYHALVSRRRLRRVLADAYADDALVTDALVEAWFEAAHQPGAKYATASLIGRRLNLDVRRELRRLRQPLLLVWGERAVHAPVDDVRGFQVLKPDTRVVILDAAGLPHDERPREFTEALLGFLDQLAQERPAARRAAS